MGFLTALANLVRRAVGLVLPVFAKARDYQGLGPTLRWALHIVLVAALLVGLWAINAYTGLVIFLTHAPPGLNQFWLPLLGLLVYALSWLGWWLWKLLWPEKELSDFPDIDEAWDQAVGALYEAGIDLTEAPLFLVLGRPEGGEAALFNAAQLQLDVRGAPAGRKAPLHVYAGRDGVYVTCAGCSVLGRQATLFAEGDRGGGGDNGAAAASAPNPEDMFKTIAPSQDENVKKIQEILRKAQKEGRSLTDDEKQQIRALGGSGESAAQPRASRRAALLKNADVELYTARFKHLCGLIVRDRRPYCPANGLMVLVPLAATEGEDVANQVAGFCQQDLAGARAALQLHCPVFGLLCDLETVPGFGEFLERFPVEERLRRIGQRFPLVPDLPPEDVTNNIDRLVHWVCHDLLGTWVYKRFRVETSAEKKEMVETVRGNVRLYGLLRHMHEVDRPLARIVTRGLATPHNGLALFGGCYIAGTGLEPGQQGFIAGVFRRLLESQNYVSWTDEGLAEEADHERWAQRSYIALAVLVVVFIGLLALLFVKPPGT